MDFENLAEFLTSMARRERRELKSRLSVLLAHLLKWEYQPEKRTKSWELTIHEQRQALADIVDQTTLSQHAEESLHSVYERAKKNAEIEVTVGNHPAYGS